MKLLAHLEELDKKRFKKAPQPYQGSFSIVDKYKSKHGPQETKFVKRIDLEDQLEDLINELQSRVVINHVNQAFRAFGYKTNLLSIPLDMSWHLERAKDGVNEIHIVSSGFNKGKPMAVHRKGFEANKIAIARGEFVYALVGNKDANMGNVIAHSKKSHQNYAIDFAQAFQNEIHKFQLPTTEENEDKLQRWAKYLTFWDSYIEHNKEHVLELVRAEENKIVVQAKSELEKLGFDDSEIDEYIGRIEDISRGNVNRLESNFTDLAVHIDEEQEQVKKLARKRK